MILIRNIKKDHQCIQKINDNTVSAIVTNLITLEPFQVQFNNIFSWVSFIKKCLFANGRPIR